jgi:hypothetical protein
MLNEYIVRYQISKTLEEIYVQAHDEKQAEIIAKIQVQSTRNSMAKFEVISIHKKGEPDTYLKSIEKYVSWEIIDKKIES